MTTAPSDLIAQARFYSPIGPLHAAATARGLAWLNFDSPDFDGVPTDPSQRWLAAAGAQLAAYWQNPRTRFTVTLELQGTPFQRAVWAALRDIPAGGTCSYADIAARVGSPRAVRAVGSANGRNPVAIIVPCHRVIGRDGTLTGYAGGLPRKAALLSHESGQRRLP